MSTQQRRMAADTMCVKKQHAIDVEKKYHSR